jgi:hypothetical protein
MLVEIRTAFRIRGTVDWDLKPGTPTQMKQSLYMIRVKVRKENTVQGAGRKTAAQIKLPGIQKITLIVHL